MAWERSQLVQALRTERPLVGTLLLALAVEAGLSVLEPWPIQVIFDNVILERPPAALLVSVGGPLWQKVAPHLLGVMIALLIGLALLHGAALYVQNTVLSRLTQRVVNRLRVRLFSHVLDLPVAYFQRVGAGEIVSRIASDTADIQALVEGGIVLVGRSLPTIVAISAVMFWIDYHFALLALAVTPLLGWSTLFFGRKVKQASRTQRGHETQVATLAEGTDEKAGHDLIRGVMVSSLPVTNTETMGECHEDGPEELFQNGRGRDGDLPGAGRRAGCGRTRAADPCRSSRLPG